MKAVIMAGGEGSRLRPLTCARPKPLVPLVNQPVMAYTIQLLRQYGIRDIAVTLQYLPQAVIDYFGDGSAWGVNLQYYIEDQPLGTAGSVKNAAEFLDDLFIVISGDAITDFNLDRAVEFHRRKQAVATLILTCVNNPLEYGVVLTDDQGRIRQFLEKPGWSEVFSDQVNTGIYLLEPEVLAQVPSGQMFDFSKDLFPRLLRQQAPLMGVVLEGYWCDIGNLQQYLQSHRDLLDGKAAVELPGREVSPGIWLGEGVRLHPEAIVQAPIAIGDYCRIGAGAKIGAYSVLGANTVIGSQASVKRSVLWPFTKVDPSASLRGTVLGQGVQVGSKAAVYEESVIGDGSVLEPVCVVNPGIKVWPNKRIDQKVRVTSNMIWGTRLGSNLFGREGIGGIINNLLTPEFACRLAAAYGTSLPPGAGILVSRGDGGASAMLAGAVIAGLAGAGVQVVDGAVITTPVHRLAVRALGLHGGIHVKADAFQPRWYWLLPVDGRGANLDRSMERKVEQYFWREEFRRPEYDEIQDAVVAKGLLEAYQEKTMASIPVSSLQEARFKIVLAHQGEQESPVTEMLRSLNCRLVVTHYPQEEGFKRIIARAAELGQQVIEQGAELGVIIDRNEELLFLVDHQGRLVSDQQLWLLFTQVILHTREGGTMVVPVTAPSAVEQIAAGWNGRVVRAKASIEALMDQALHWDGKQPKAISQFSLQSDAVQGLVQILALLAKQQTTLAELIDDLPAFHYRTATIECPWEEKGRVMRTLYERYQEQPVELTDGLKVFHPQGWTLMLPDRQDPVYRIYSEGFSQEIAEELTDMHINEINAIVQHQ